MTDGQGKTVECKKAIFIMTSNLAQTEIADHALSLRQEAERVQRAKMDAQSAGMCSIRITLNVSSTFRKHARHRLQHHYFSTLPRTMRAAHSQGVPTLI